MEIDELHQTHSHTHSSPCAHFYKPNQSNSFALQPHFNTHPFPGPLSLAGREFLPAESVPLNAQVYNYNIKNHLTISTGLRQILKRYNTQNSLRQKQKKERRKTIKYITTHRHWDAQQCSWYVSQCICEKQKRRRKHIKCHVACKSCKMINNTQSVPLLLLLLQVVDGVGKWIEEF